MFDNKVWTVEKVFELRRHLHNPRRERCVLRPRRNDGAGPDPGEGAEADGADPRAGYGGAPGRGGRRRRLILLLRRRHLPQVRAVPLPLSYSFLREQEGIDWCD